MGVWQRGAVIVSRARSQEERLQPLDDCVTWSPKNSFLESNTLVMPVFLVASIKEKLSHVADTERPSLCAGNHYL